MRPAIVYGVSLMVRADFAIASAATPRLDRPLLTASDPTMRVTCKPELPRRSTRGSRRCVACVIAIFATLWSAACDKSGMQGPPRVMSSADADRLIFPVLTVPPASVDESRCGSAAAPSWLREAAQYPHCTDSLRDALTVFLSAPLGDDAAITPAHAQDLLTAAATCDAVGALERLLARGVDVNGRDACGGTALVAAASSGGVNVTHRLLEAGADPNVSSGEHRWYRTPLLAAVIRADGDLARVLVDAGADPNAATPSGRSVLMYAATARDRRLIEALLRHGADPCRKDETGLDATRVAFAHNLLVEAALLGGETASCGAEKGGGNTAGQAR